MDVCRHLIFFLSLFAQMALAPQQSFNEDDAFPDLCLFCMFTARGRQSSDCVLERQGGKEGREEREHG